MYVIDKDNCAQCGLCSANCPQNAIVNNNGFEINHDECVECGTCIDNCPTGAISVK